MLKRGVICALFFVFFICSFDAMAEDSINEGITESSSESGQIEISAVKSKIRWDEDIIRSWDASGDVEIVYSRGGRTLECKSEKALFTREGPVDAFKDRVEISGDVIGELDGMKIEASSVTLISAGESYSVQTGNNTKVTGEDYSVITDNLLFDASNGIGEFPEGAKIQFELDASVIGKNRSPGKSEGNFFGQCLNIDTSNGEIIAPQLRINYVTDVNGKFALSRIEMPSGAELHPVDQFSETNETKFTFDKAEIDFTSPSFNARGEVTIANGPCSIKCQNLSIDWSSRKMTMQGEVVLERESVQFQTGLIELGWDTEGRISLVASEYPKMTIIVSSETTDEILKTSPKNQ